MKTIETKPVGHVRVPTCRPLSVSTKVHVEHLERLAIVYVRQSSARQVQENVESTQLQYRLVDRAEALGWPRERIQVIDDDLGVSGQSIAGRAGFQRLLAEVGLDHVGLVLGIEMSRLARSCRDWHQLLELCAVFGTLLGDADGVYEPRDYNDRLLLGLKGTMSEAELHILQGRLGAGKRNKARRGEYYNHAPIGYVRTRDGMMLEPDDQARGVVRRVFDKFRELGSVSGVLRDLLVQRIQLGVRDHRGPQRGELQWRDPNRATLLGMLHHPIYAGAYVYGRRETDPRRRVAGKPGSGRRWARPEDWEVLIRDALPGYISWDEWERNQQKLRENGTRYGCGAPRGTSLLAGRVFCGRCGRRLSVSYSGQSKARFTCDAARHQWGQSQCQAFAAWPLESLIVKQLLRALEPASLELSLRAAESIEDDRRRVEEHHRQSVERAAYHVDLAQRRYSSVDPTNRLVAAELERQWEAALRSHRTAEEELDRFRQRQTVKLTPEQRQHIESLAQDIPALWQAPTTTGEERQLILRALVERITVAIQGETERVSVTIRWQGGFESRHDIRRLVKSFEKLDDAQKILVRINELRTGGYSYQAIADCLNREGYHSARATAFTEVSVAQLARRLRREGRLPECGVQATNTWRSSQLAQRLGIKPTTLNTWRRRGWVQAEPVGSRWIYWADPRELNRLHKLAAHARKKLNKTPLRLTSPLSRAHAKTAPKSD